MKITMAQSILNIYSALKCSICNVIYCKCNIAFAVLYEFEMYYFYSDDESAGHYIHLCYYSFQMDLCSVLNWLICWSFGPRSRTVKDPEDQAKFDQK